MPFPTLTLACEGCSKANCASLAGIVARDGVRVEDGASGWRGFFDPRRRNENSQARHLQKIYLKVQDKPEMPSVPLLG